MSCEGCHTSVRGQVAAREAVKTRAIAYARETEKTVVIWQEGFEFQFAEIGSPAAQGKPITEVVSPYYGVTT